MIKPLAKSSENSTIESIQPILIKNPASKIESGKTHKIMVVESIKLFSLSFSFPLNFAKYEIVNIIVALIIENENPTSKLYSKRIQKYG